MLMAYTGVHWTQTCSGLAPAYTGQVENGPSSAPRCILFRQQNSLLANFIAFSPSGVSFTANGVYFSPPFLTTRAFFTPNRLHRISPYLGHTDVPPRAPPPPGPPPQKKTCPPAAVPAPAQTRPRPAPPPSHVAPVVPAWLPAMLPRLPRPPLLEIRAAKARKH